MKEHCQLQVALLWWVRIRIINRDTWNSPKTTVLSDFLCSIAPQYDSGSLRLFLQLLRHSERGLGGNTNVILSTQLLSSFCDFVLVLVRTLFLWFFLRLSRKLFFHSDNSWVRVDSWTSVQVDVIFYYFKLVKITISRSALILGPSFIKYIFYQSIFYQSILMTYNLFLY